MSEEPYGVFSQLFVSVFCLYLNPVCLCSPFEWLHMYEWAAGKKPSPTWMLHPFSTQTPSPRPVYSTFSSLLLPSSTV